MKIIKNMEAIFLASVLCGLTLTWISNQQAYELQMASSTPIHTANVQHMAPQQGASA